jgi:hypothetical protein
MLTPGGEGTKKGGRTWVLQADNRDQLVGWVSAIEHAFLSQFDDDKAVEARQNFTTFQVPLQSFNMLVQVLLPGTSGAKLTLSYEMVRHRKLGELKELFMADAVAKNLIPKGPLDQHFLQVMDTDLIVADDSQLAMDDFLAPETEVRLLQLLPVSLRQLKSGAGIACTTRPLAACLCCTADVAGVSAGV